MSPRIGFVGYGRFGQAMSELLSLSGYHVNAYDPQRPDLCESLSVLAENSDVLLFAVPVLAFESSLRQMRPHLTERHVVVDVCSVKVRPVEVMQSLLGEDVPWVATHPLFGPVSLARGDRSLSVVLCPGPHNAAEKTVRTVFEDLGCTVVVEDADAHDQRMADTHAVAFFIAKGVLDAGFVDFQHVPPSFKAIERTVMAVREDAGHLLSTIHGLNPYAAASRTRLIEALAKLDVRLCEQPQAEEIKSLPPQRSDPKELKETRAHIDDIDAEILQLLVRRAELSRRAGQAKEAQNRPIRDPQREARLLADRMEQGRLGNLPEQEVKEVFEAILRLSRSLQAS